MIIYKMKEMEDCGAIYVVTLGNEREKIVNNKCILEIHCSWFMFVCCHCTHI